jgi:hypothetical protein
MADLAANKALTAKQTLVTLTDFSTADLPGVTFLQPGTPFDGSVFTTPRQGFYFLGFNIRVDQMSGGWFHVNVIRNGEVEREDHGLSTLRGTDAYNYWTFSTAGVVKAPTGTEYSVAIMTQSDEQYTVHSASGFTAFEVYPDEGVYAVPSANTVITNTAISTVQNWKTDDVQSFLQGGTFDPTTGAYTVQEDGIFLLAFNPRFNRVTSQAGGFVRAFIDINNQNEIHGGLSSIQGRQLSDQ